jgi:hypothetical protein
MTTLRQLAEAAAVPLTDRSALQKRLRDVAKFHAATNPAAILELLDTIDAQRKLLERAEVVLSASYGDAYDEALEDAVWNDITAHLEATK